MTVGLISDTHGFWDDRIPTLFAGVTISSTPETSVTLRS